MAVVGGNDFVHRSTRPLSASAATSGSLQVQVVSPSSTGAATSSNGGTAAESSTAAASRSPYASPLSAVGDDAAAKPSSLDATASAVSLKSPSSMASDTSMSSSAVAAALISATPTAINPANLTTDSSFAQSEEDLAAEDDDDEEEEPVSPAVESLRDRRILAAAAAAAAPQHLAPLSVNSATAADSADSAGGAATGGGFLGVQSARSAISASSPIAAAASPAGAAAAAAAAGRSLSIRSVGSLGSDLSIPDTELSEDNLHVMSESPMHQRSRPSSIDVLLSSPTSAAPSPSNLQRTTRGLPGHTPLNTPTHVSQAVSESYLSGGPRGEAVSVDAFAALLASQSTALFPPSPVAPSPVPPAAAPTSLPVVVAAPQPPAANGNGHASPAPPRRIPVDAETEKIGNGPTRRVDNWQAFMDGSR